MTADAVLWTADDDEYADARLRHLSRVNNAYEALIAAAENDRTFAVQGSSFPTMSFLPERLHCKADTSFWSTTISVAPQNGSPITA